MNQHTPLAPDALFHRCDPENLPFATTSELADLTEILGQARAMDAVHFGVGIQKSGYNLYVMGPSGMGKYNLVRQFLDGKAAERPTPPDWCYINNFDQPHKPKALRLPAGHGVKLQADMEQFIDELATILPATFEGDEYRTRLQTLDDELKERQEKAFAELSEEASTQKIKLFRTPSGFAFAPMKEDEVVGPDEFDTWPQEEQTRVEQVVATLQEKLQNIIQQIAQWRKETREKVKQLNEEITGTAVGHLIDELKRCYGELPDVVEYFAKVEKDIVENVKDFLKPKETPDGFPGAPGEADPRQLHRYKVNVLVDNSMTKGAPVVYSDHPTYLNLVGRAEHLAQFGTLVTDFTLLKPGALHEAVGGYLIIDAHRLLTQPYAWEGLKRALHANEIRIESLEKMLSLVSTVSLEPEPIPLDIKVFILGDRMIYYLLYQYDPDFPELFKVAADFEERIERTSETHLLYAKLIATVGRKESLRPFDNNAVARVIEHGSRLVDDKEKLTVHIRSIANVLRESDHIASEKGHDVVTRQDVQEAIDLQVRRASRLKERMQEAIERGTILIDTDGARVGQINGLSVLSMGEYAFGQPSRITATTHIGEGHVVDIEREVELGGAIHSKGVLILSSFLASRYAQDRPLSLSASLVFEQSYGMVEGDSASLAELCALLSSLSGLPIKQSMAVTGSVNQHGQVQPIGGVNEKIEGFFGICKARGLTGEQGVLIPVSNAKHLMLNEEVVNAAADKKFHIYAIERVDQALELLMGTPAGEMDQKGRYPRDSINALVQHRLTEMSQIRQSFADRLKRKREGTDDSHGIELGDD